MLVHILLYAETVKYDDDEYREEMSWMKWNSLEHFHTV